jgi:hypothetical protein
MNVNGPASSSTDDPRRISIETQSEIFLRLQQQTFSLHLALGTSRSSGFPPFHDGPKKLTAKQSKFEMPHYVVLQNLNTLPIASCVQGTCTWYNSSNIIAVNATYCYEIVLVGIPEKRVHHASSSFMYI